MTKGVEDGTKETDCKHCGHTGFQHDEEFGKCGAWHGDCQCPGYEPIESPDSSTAPNLFRELAAEMSMVIHLYMDAGIDHRQCLPPEDFCHIRIRARAAIDQWNARP